VGRAVFRLEDAAIDAAAHMLDECAEQSAIRISDNGIAVQLNTGLVHNHPTPWKRTSLCTRRRPYCSTSLEISYRGTKRAGARYIAGASRRYYRAKRRGATRGAAVPCAHNAEPRARRDSRRSWPRKSLSLLCARPMLECRPAVR